MKLASFLALAALVVGTFPQSFMVNTPGTTVECVPTQITFTGGSAPYTLFIQTPDANGAIIQEYSDITSSPFTWTTNVTGSTTVGITLRDSTGASAQTAPFTVSSGSDASCLAAASASASGSSTSTNSGSSASSGSTVSTPSTSGSSASSATSALTSSSGSSSASASSTTSGSASSTHSSTSSSGSTSSSRSTSGSSTSTSTSPSATTSTDASMANTASAGLVGVIGFLLASFMA